MVGCVDETVEVYRTPTAAAYRDVSRAPRSGLISVQAFPDVVLTLAEIFA